MVKLQNGKANQHVLTSKGADQGFMDFYRTEYSRNHGVEGFLPRIGKHPGTGYQSNLRPGVYYSRKLDEQDNPAMGRLLKENYTSTMKDSFRQYKGSNGTDPFAKDVSDRNTGFNSNNQPSRDAYSVKSAPQSLTGSRKLLDRDISLGKPLSENHSQFYKKDPLVDTCGKSVGRRKEESGFTHAKNIEPITYYPDECHHGSTLMNAMRPTGTSIMQTSYLPSQLPHGDERFRNISVKAEKDNGFTRFIRPSAAMTSSNKDTYTALGDLNPIVQKKIMKEDPAERVNLLHPDPYLTMKQAAYQGKQILDEPFLSTKNCVGIGDKEGTGFTANNKDVGCLPDGIANHSTVYKEQFYNKNVSKSVGNPFQIDVVEPAQDGYTKNEKVHASGTYAKETGFKDVLHPYVSKSLRARDPFYDDKTHEHKKISLKC